MMKRFYLLALAAIVLSSCSATVFVSPKTVSTKSVREAKIIGPVEAENCFFRWGSWTNNDMTHHGDIYEVLLEKANGMGGNSVVDMQYVLKDYFAFLNYESWCLSARGQAATIE